MIILTAWTDGSQRPILDFCTLNTIHCISKLSPRDARKIEPLEPGVLDKLLPGEKVYMIGHGDPQEVPVLLRGKKVWPGQTVSDLKPDQIASKLKSDPSRSVSTTPKIVPEIVLIACHAGTEDPRAPGSSFLARTCQELNNTKTTVPYTGTIKAYRGPCSVQFKPSAGPTFKEKTEFYEKFASGQVSSNKLSLRVLKGDHLDDMRNKVRDILKNFMTEHHLTYKDLDRQCDPGSIPQIAASTATFYLDYFDEVMKECEDNGWLYSENDSSAEVTLPFSTK